MIDFLELGTMLGCWFSSVDGPLKKIDRNEEWAGQEERSYKACTECTVHHTELGLGICISIDVGHRDEIYDVIAMTGNQGVFFPLLFALRVRQSTERSGSSFLRCKMLGSASGMENS